jgi:hypothetical protein
MKSLVHDFINLSNDVDLNSSTCFMSRARGGWMNHDISAENLFVILKEMLNIEEFSSVLSDDFSLLDGVEHNEDYWIRTANGGNRFKADSQFFHVYKTLYTYQHCNRRVGINGVTGNVIDTLKFLGYSVNKQLEKTIDKLDKVNLININHDKNIFYVNSIFKNLHFIGDKEKVKEV